MKVSDYMVKHRVLSLKTLNWLIGLDLLLLHSITVLEPRQFVIEKHLAIYQNKINDLFDRLNVQANP